MLLLSLLRLLINPKGLFGACFLQYESRWFVYELFICCFRVC
ncbi:hypothetical protein V6Z11_A03G236300 [Gossypium hirsutum]